jgi:hypothetical protein
MEEIHILIGQHRILIHSYSPHFSDWIEIYFKRMDSVLNKVDLVIEIQSGYGVPFESYDVNIQSSPNMITYQRADYILEIDASYNKAEISAYNELALKHALNNLYSAFIIHNNWGLLIHSSCVKHQEKAYLFAGHSGAGKSTVARLSAPRVLLSDEATLVKINESTIQIFDSPFRSELVSNSVQVPCTTAEIFLLHQSQDVKTVPMKKSDAFLHLMDKIFYWQHDAKETKKLTTMLKQLVRQAPASELYFQKNDHFWGLIS